MASGYIAGARGDLDSLFLARTSTAIANTGFLSNGGVDLAQRFEPRAGSTAIANTGFVSGSSDLATLFKDINASTAILTLTMTCGSATAGATLGYRNPASGYTAMTGQAMSGTPEWTKTSTLYRLDEINFDGPTDQAIVRVSNASATPANTDAVWSFMALTGIFSNSGGISARRVVSRVSQLSTNTHTTPNGRPGRSYQGLGVGSWRMIAGNVYTLEIG